MKKTIFGILLTVPMLHSQAVRWDTFIFTSNASATASPQPGVYYPILSIPSVSVQICSYPANSVPCTNYATTYTDSSQSVTCPNLLQLTRNGSSICVGTSDGQGNVGAWFAPGHYQYTFTTPKGTPYGPYDITVSGSSSGTVNSSPQYSLFYQPVSGSSATAQGDPNVTTDGSGNVSSASINGLFSVAGLAKADLHTYSNVVITASSSTLTSSNASFTPADVGKLISVPMGTQGIASSTYSSGGTITGTTSETCIVNGFNGGGTGAEAIVLLTGTNTIAGGTLLYPTVYGTGYTSFPTSATLNNGSATCSGTVTLTGGSYFYWPVTTTISGYTNSTTVTLATSATSTVNGTFAYGAWIGTDNLVLIQPQVTASRTNHNCVTIPPGKYGLSAPITVTGGECIMGWNGFQSAATATVLYPAFGSAAIATQPPTTNSFPLYQNFRIQDLNIVGGQNGIDLGLSHFVSLNRISCYDQTGWCFSHVVGERHRIENIQCFHFNTVGGGCISVSDPKNSIYWNSAYKNGIVQTIFNAGVVSNVATVQTTPGSSNPPAIGQQVTIAGLTSHSYLNGTWTVSNSSSTVVQFALVHADDSIASDSGTATSDYSQMWWDKAVMERISDQGQDNYTIWSDGNVRFPGSFSNVRMNYVVAEGSGQPAATAKSLFRAYGVQFSNFSIMSTDAIHTSAPAVFDVYGEFNQSSIRNLILSPPGNSYANGVYFHGSFQGSSIENSYLGGDNAVNIGAHFGTSTDVSGTIRDTRASLFTDASSTAAKNHLTITGGTIYPTNMLGSILFSEQTNNNIAFLLSGDSLGNVAATSEFDIWAVTNVQQYTKMLAVNASRITAGKGIINFAPISSNASPINGDCWTQATGFFCYINGATVGPIPCLNACSFTGTTALQAVTVSSNLDLTGGSSVLQFGAADTGLSRIAAAEIGVGNGTATDASGKVRAAQFRLSNSGFLNSLQTNTLTGNWVIFAPNGNSATVMAASLTTTAATADTVTVQGMTSTGHCQLTPTNAAGATNIATTYISAKTTNQITVAHPATASMTYDVFCTSN